MKRGPLLALALLLVFGHGTKGMAINSFIKSKVPSFGRSLVIVTDSDHSLELRSLIMTLDTPVRHLMC